MMYIGRCPDCGKALRGGHGDPIKKIASPLCSCPHCGSAYLDENMYEWAVLAPESQLFYIYLANNRWVLHGFAVVTSFALQHWLFFPICIFISMLLCYIWVCIASQDDFEKSKIRCSSQGYRDILVQAGYTKMDQRFYDDYNRRRKLISSKSTPSNSSHTTATSAVPASVSPSSSSTPAFKNFNSQEKISYLIWSHTQLFVQHTGLSLDRKQFMYVWSVYFYAVTKSINNQKFIDGIYSYFDKHAIRYVREPDTRSYVVQEMRTDYREIRPTLIGSGIDPATDSGKALLWDLLLDWIRPTSPYSNEARERFCSDVKILMSYSRHLYAKSPVSAHSVKFSISDTDCKLPENQ